MKQYNSSLYYARSVIHKPFEITAMSIEEQYGSQPLILGSNSKPTDKQKKNRTLKNSVFTLM